MPVFSESILALECGSKAVGGGVRQELLFTVATIPLRSQGSALKNLLLMEVVSVSVPGSPLR